MRTSQPSATALLHTLNATPMMDVMLVLLVVFMVVTPLIHSGPNLELPRANKFGPVPEEGGLTVRLSFTGELSTERGTMSRAELVRLLENRPEITLLLEADRRLPFRRVEEVLAEAGVAGLREVSLVAQRSQE